MVTVSVTVSTTVPVLSSVVLVTRLQVPVVFCRYFVLVRVFLLEVDVEVTVSAVE